MVIVITLWIGALVVLSMIIGELVFRKTNSGTSHPQRKFNLRNFIDCYDKDFTMHHLENPEIISNWALQKRGSWRLAQDRNMSYGNFSRLRDKEYDKKLN